MLSAGVPECQKLEMYRLHLGGKV